MTEPNADRQLASQPTTGASREAAEPASADAPRIPWGFPLAWHFSAEAAPAVREGLARGHLGPIRAVKQNRRRTVFTVPEPPAGIPPLFVKLDHPTNPRDLLKGLWRCKANVEFRHASTLQAHGIPTVRPLAWARHGVDSILVTEALVGIADLSEVWAATATRPDQRQAMVAGLGGFLATLVLRGVVHPDLHPGNLAARRVATGFELFLLDPYGVRLVPPRASAIPAILGTMLWLNGWGRTLPDETRHRLLDPPAKAFQSLDPATPWSANRLWGRILGLARRASLARWPGLRARLLRHSSLVTQTTAATGTWRLAAGVTADTMETAVHQHHQALASGVGVVKTDRKRCLTRVTVGEQSLVVKEYRSPRGCGRWRADARGWLNTHRLHHECFPVARPLGWLRHTSGSGLIVWEDAGSENLPDCLRQSDGATRERLVAEAARILAALHDYGIRHGDAKTTNFVVGPADASGSRQLTLVDCDASTFSGGVPDAKAEREVNSFVATLPEEWRETLARVFRSHYHACRL